MAGENQLLIRVGANTDKLRADLALAQADVTAFGRELKAAAQEARNTGDYSKVQELSGRYEDARKSVLGLNQEIRNTKDGGGDDSGWIASLRAAFGRMHTAMQPVREGLSELHNKASEFGNALSEVAGNIFPRFRDLFAIGAIGGAVGLVEMVRKTAEWGHELEKAADTLGVSVNAMAGLKKAAGSVGVDSDSLVRGLTRFGANVEKAQEEQKKLGIEATKIIYENVQQAAGGIADLTKRAASAGDQVKRFFKVDDADFSKIGDQLRLIYNLGGIGLTLPGESFDNFKIRATAALQSTGKEAEKLREIIFKMGGEISAGNLATALDRGLPKYKDTLKSIGVDVIDPLTGKIKNAEDIIVDFVDHYSKLDINKQQAVGKEMIGRGFVEMLPFLKMGKEELTKFLDAAKKDQGLEVQVRAAAELNRALLRLDLAFKSIQRAFILPFVDVFKAPTESMESFVSAIKTKVSGAAKEMALSIKPLIEDLVRIFRGEAPQSDFERLFVSLKQKASDALTYIQSAFEKLMGTLNNVAGAINAVFGTNLSGKTLLFALGIIKLTGAFSALTAGIKLAQAALALIYLNPWTIAITAIAAGALLIYANWDKIAPLFQKLWDLVKQIATEIGGGFVSAWNAAAATIKGSWGDLTAFIGEKIDQILGLYDKVVSAAKNAASSIASLLGAASGGSAAPSAGTGGGYSSGTGAGLDNSALAGGALVYASGGYISGPGTGTSDSILARVSTGEHVTRAAAVSHYGVGFFHALNNMQIPKFSMGGLVGAFSPSLPSFAGGGLVASGGSYGTLNLTIGGQTASLHVQNRSGYDDVVRASRSEQRTSAGAKPSWYGS